MSLRIQFMLVIFAELRNFLICSVNKCASIRTFRARIAQRRKSGNELMKHTFLFNNKAIKVQLEKPRDEKIPHKYRMSEWTNFPNLLVSISAKKPKCEVKKEKSIMKYEIAFCARRGNICFCAITFGHESSSIEDEVFVILQLRTKETHFFGWRFFVFSSQWNANTSSSL